MTTRSAKDARRITEAARLIDMARALLDRQEEDIVVNYLDHAVAALHIVSECKTEQPTLELHA